MFDDVAARYDLTNDVLSLGQARLWRRGGRRRRRRPARRAGARPGRGHRHLLAAVRRGPARTSCPATSRSACSAEGKRRHPWLPFTAGDATRLPFRDGVFDAVTISFGLRNVQDTDAALRELYRVTRPGGRVVICEFSHPTWAPVPHRLHRVPDAGAAAGGARPCRPAPTRTSTSPSPSAPGPTSPRWPRRLQKAGWARSAWRQPDRRHRGAAPGRTRP